MIYGYIRGSTDKQTLEKQEFEETRIISAEERQENFKEAGLIEGTESDDDVWFIKMIGADKDAVIIHKEHPKKIKILDVLYKNFIIW